MSAGMPPLLSASQPRYLLLAQALIDDIRAGRYAVGSLLPTEFELCEQFNVSRHTVREAIRRLSELGLIVKQQGVGSRVKATQASQRYVQTSEGISDLHQYVREVRLEIGEHRELAADEGLAEILECKPGQLWLQIDGMRRRADDNLPLACTTVFIPRAYRGVVEDLDDGRTPLYDLLQRRYRMTVDEVRQEISAVTIDAADARQLEVAEGAPGLRILRKYYANGELLEVAVNIHPGERFVYAVTQRLAWQGQDA